MACLYSSCRGSGNFPSIPGLHHLFSVHRTTILTTTALLHSTKGEKYEEFKWKFKLSLFVEASLSIHLSDLSHSPIRNLLRSTIITYYNMHMLMGKISRCTLTANNASDSSYRNTYRPSTVDLLIKQNVCSCTTTKAGLWRIGEVLARLFVPSLLFSLSASCQFMVYKLPGYHRVPSPASLSP